MDPEGDESPLGHAEGLLFVAAVQRVRSFENGIPEFDQPDPQAEIRDLAVETIKIVDGAIPEVRPAAILDCFAGRVDAGIADGRLVPGRRRRGDAALLGAGGGNSARSWVQETAEKPAASIAAPAKETSAARVRVRWRSDWSAIRVVSCVSRFGNRYPPSAIRSNAVGLVGSHRTVWLSSTRLSPG